jgi:hypothetical protein
MADNADPFATGLFGGSLKMATSASETSTGHITVLGNRSEPETSLSVPATKSSCAPPKETRRSRGATRAFVETVKPASNATSSATGARTSRRSLSDRLTPSLIAAGLVCGITPSSTRKQSGQPILVLALDMPGGGGAARLKRDSSYSSATPIKDTDNG